MKRFALCFVVLSMLAATLVGAAGSTDKPVNAMCPIGKEAIIPSAGTIEYKGHTIGLCCPGCGKAFMAWDESRRDDFVALAQRGAEPGHQVTEKKSDDDTSTSTTTETPEDVALYPLDFCIVAKAKLGSMGDPVVKVYDGREIRFCCAPCVKKFEGAQAGYFKALDEAIVQDQMRYYPTDTCVVMGDPLFEDGKDIAVNLVHGDRLVRLCCPMCVRKFKADPETYLKKLDEAVIDAQRKAYPMDTCIVAKGALGSMGEPTEMIVAGRLLRFCCAACEPRVKKDPTTYLTMIDKAWQAQGKYLPETKRTP